MKHLFVPYKLALLAKEKGFDEDCVGYYLSKSELEPVIQANSNPNKDAPDWKNTISAPLYQQLIDWLFEKHDINIHHSLLGSEDTLIKDAKHCVSIYKNTVYNIVWGYGIIVETNEFLSKKEAYDKA